MYFVARTNAWLAWGFALAWNVLHKWCGWIDLRILLAGTFDWQQLVGVEFLELSMWPMACDCD